MFSKQLAMEKVSTAFKHKHVGIEGSSQSLTTFRSLGATSENHVGTHWLVVRMSTMPERCERKGPQHMFAVGDGTPMSRSFFTRSSIQADRADFL
jgi:hypothetical protein